MDYGKELKEALFDVNTPYIITAWIEKKFPELKESEDERMRKSIIELVEWVKEQQIHTDHNTDGTKWDDMIAWLEKKWNGSYLQEKIESFTNAHKGEDPEETIAVVRGKNLITDAMTHRINDGIIIRGRVYELVEHPGGEQRLCNDCELWRFCAKNNLCNDAHGKNYDGSEVWYNYKEVELKPIMA